MKLHLHDGAFRAVSCWLWLGIWCDLFFFLGANFWFGEFWSLHTKSKFLWIFGFGEFWFCWIRAKKHRWVIWVILHLTLGKPHHHPIEPTLVGFQCSFWWIFFSKKGPLVVGQVGVIFLGWDTIHLYFGILRDYFINQWVSRIPVKNQGRWLTVGSCSALRVVLRCRCSTSPLRWASLLLQVWLCFRCVVLRQRLRFHCASPVAWESPKGWWNCFFVGKNDFPRKKWPHRCVGEVFFSCFRWSSETICRIHSKPQCWDMVVFWNTHLL